MILAIDVGNTNIVLGVLDDENIFFVSRIATDHQKTEDQYAVEIKEIITLYGIDVSKIDGGIVSSVVPPLSDIFCKTVEKVIKCKPLLVGPGIKTGLNILIDNPAQLGSDLVVGAVAAIAEYQKPIVIFDLGTATTVSVIDKNGSFLGGLIYPGIRISLEALSSRTSQLPRISLDAPRHVIGKNTIDCMGAGIIYGNAAMIDGVAQRIAKELSQQPTVLLTGGLARSILPYCNSDVHYDADLMLKGLRIIYNKNK